VIRQPCRQHLVRWDVRVQRLWAPFYTNGLTRRYDEEPHPPIDVIVSARFDTEESALDFEWKVRELLQCDDEEVPCSTSEAGTPATS
jgi:hypothetical protein